MKINELFAPGWPGILPKWTSSAKVGVGTALTSASSVWFTLSHGIFNEVYYPRVDQACIRDLGLIVTDGSSFFSEEKRHARSNVSTLAPGVPAFRLRNVCMNGRYSIEKRIVTDPSRDVVLQATRFAASHGAIHDYQVYALLAPHLGNYGSGNTAWVGEYKGRPMLFAERGGVALALACDPPWLAGSAGFVGTSDGWQELSRHKHLATTFGRAENGDVALTGQVALSRNGSFVLALGFGRNAAEAGHRASASLLDGFDDACAGYVAEWSRWQQEHADAIPTGSEADLYRTSLAVIRAHEEKRFPGGLIASLSIPWGFEKGDEDLGGYHLVWPRDLVEAAGALVAAGATDDAMRIASYLEVTQETDGHWPQNMWIDGTPFWNGIQMDETAFPILLLDLLGRSRCDVTRFWPMVRRAAGFLVRNGPVTQQDRWEEDAGYSPFTAAVEIAGLLAAADLADAHSELAIARYLRDTADAWNACIERWTYASGTPLAKRLEVDGYYVRIAPVETADAASPLSGFVPIKNRPLDWREAPATEIVSPDALALVRFGLRAPDDPRITNTVRVIDALLKTPTPHGDMWRRYNGDGYGEHEDGAPFDGLGVGRLWPLLTGERAHYELAAGRTAKATELFRTLDRLANEGGLLPEQIWDGPDLPERELLFGRPSGSAMPLVWAHAEYVKLRRSLQDGRVFDMPPQAAERYVVRHTPARHAIWRFNHKCREAPAGLVLRLEVLVPAMVHWSADHWRTVQDTGTVDTGLGIHVCDLPVQRLAPKTRIDFTFFWPQANRWEQLDFAVTLTER
jgi:glucoamylase